MDEEKHYPVMFDTYRSMHELEMLQRQIPWVPMSDRPPPGPGWYSITVSTDIHDDGCKAYSVRPREHWDGERWVNQGAYVRVEAWCWEIRPWDGVVREISVPAI